MNKRYNLNSGDRVINPSTGERKTIKWADSTHIQFEGGNSCAARNFGMFYSECDIERGDERKPWISGDDRKDR